MIVKLKFFEYQFGVDFISKMSIQFPLDPAQYQILHQIGSSSDADIILARCIPNNKLVAIKQYDMEITNLTIQKIAQEVTLWSTLSHPNAVKYYGSFCFGSKIWLLIECIDGGSLSDILKDFYPSGINNEVLIASILQKVLLFLDYFHSHQQMHRDLKTNKILVSMDGEIKVCGFCNVSNLIQQGYRKTSRKSVLEFSNYVAPEVINVSTDGKGYSQPADIWSLGIIAYEMATGKTPYDSMNPVEQMRAIIDSDPPNLPSSCSLVFKDFVSQCLMKSPEKRATAHKLLKHDFIQTAKDSEYIETLMTSQLPPLIQRFEYHDQKKSAIIKENANMLTKKYEFDFPKTKGSHEEEKSKNTNLEDPSSVANSHSVKKGRFTISYAQPE